jgi:ribonuclease BN (tRNA processing enzyme)
MPPSVIGQIAGDAHVKRLVLSHRMLRTLGKADQTRSEIKKRYLGLQNLPTTSTASRSNNA